MKKFVLAAVAVLSLGVGSAYAQSLTPPHMIHWGSASSSDVSRK